jgi:hypothetical protein
MHIHRAQQPPVGQVLFIIEASRSHTAHHTRQDSSGRVISPTQRPLYDNTQHSQEIEVHAPAGFEPTIPASERSQNYASNRTASGIGCYAHDQEYVYIWFPW